MLSQRILQMQLAAKGWAKYYKKLFVAQNKFSPFNIIVIIKWNLLIGENHLFQSVVQFKTKSSDANPKIDWFEAALSRISFASELL